MARFGSVLIYDGECPYCSVAARALRELDEVGAISWYDDRAQSFLDAQFGDTPFAMVLVDADEGRVHAGRAAAEELAGRAGMPGIVGSLVRDNYERIATAVGLASGRGRDPDDYHETYPLSEGGRDAFDALAGAAERRDGSSGTIA
ncbi:DCC1-like thiol-disulfide oxidoreductase family protein [Haloarcula litorea]|uniref:DCC1-like thiol-disulfide oxidoreductase family protein n=1 Tax=Haloarcula litorea TaxID=3032579 RepID=UPI0023E7DE17|nr:DCC1-like thiol-disulfide oxidoreductase family protein [Halomicroarcula sp. GDY20]